MSTIPVPVFSSFYHQGLVEMGATALITYDYLITIDQEVALFWRRNMSGATALYLGTRYIGVLAYSILGTATYTPMTEKRYGNVYGSLRRRTKLSTKFCSCMGIAIAQPAFSGMQYVFFAAFSSMRTLALSKMNYMLAIVVFVFALGPFAVNVHTMSLSLVGEIFPPFGCAGSVNITRTEAIMGLCRRVAFMRNRRRHHRHHASALLINGTIYFLTLLTLNILHLLFTLLSVADGFEPISLVTVFTDPLTNILTCRFLLALQAANQQALGQGSATEDAHHGGSDTLRFASRMIGSIATVSVPARHGASTLDGEESEEGVPDADDGQGSGELSGGACEDVLVISSQAGDVVEC
ncbi:uncharacterized protein TRAVEDRAFT_47244 [Trametes versicolor FP-101664 SS1]|uniref:uncharacterized protein n=1 Tax=Trametes versicolor (strain FP-101664) TaxID=717944 RepID=UPI000462213E|nr:uncharacterized protein TRAVEDRAFT_47244 [Trametes versicolor FP-101664 SS1]EIW59948.1 hypothetical protein TRAVEDRAFT_47244 [Trametes versicolor FP-101664 SS1]